MNSLTLVTGATGYLGLRLAEALTREGPVRALVRRTSKTEPLRRLGVELVEGDLSEPSSLPAAVRGASRVFHAGAYVTRWTRDRSAFDRINVEGTRALLEAALAEGVGDFVYTSSFIGLGPSGGRVLDESAVHPGGYRNDYERTKAEALKMARVYLARPELGLKIVFPGVIFGPGALTEGNLVASILRDFLKRRFPLMGDGRGRWSYSFIDDVVRGHLLASRQGRAGGQYILGGENLSMPELLTLLERLTGVRKLPGRIPFWVGECMGWLNERLAPLGVPVKLTVGEVRIFRQDWAFSSDTAKRELNYTVTPVEEALRATIEWIRSSNR